MTVKVSSFVRAFKILLGRALVGRTIDISTLRRIKVLARKERVMGMKVQMSNTWVVCMFC